EGATDLPRLPVRLRLVDSGVSPAPTLWVLRQDGPARVEQVLAHLPDDLVERLLFAVSGELVLLRARPSPAGPPTLEIDAETYTPLLELPNLFRPTDGTLEPPLRRDRIREVLSPEPWEIAWLARTPGGFRVERIAESAFRPLGEWVEYVVAKDARALEGWVAAAQFAFDSWVDVGVEWADRPTAPVEKPEARRRKAERPEAEEEDDDEPEEDEQPLWEAPQLRPARVEIAPDLKRTALAAELMEIERSFKASEAGADAPERIDLWRRMATVHRRLGNGREAALCWVHAVWEAPDDAALARAWAEEELGAVGMDVDALREAVLREPLVDRLRAVGAALAAGALRGDAGLTPLFDRHSDQLDVRTAWLARTRIAGDDELAAARARDDALGRIRQGLSVEKDIPAFVRGLDADEATGVVD
ncbi:MAG: hypothetical protein KC656_32935, partial [Myxococcales bacterium]|nr:hypothetical protein [Myxococcales bacterium]